MAFSFRASSNLRRVPTAWRTLARLALAAILAVLLPAWAQAATGSSLQEMREAVARASADVVSTHESYEDALRAQRAATTSDWLAAADAMHAPALDQLRTQDLDLERRENDLATIYGPAYPALAEVRRRRAKLEQAMQDAVKRLLSARRVDYEAARAREAALKDSLVDLAGAAESVPLEVDSSLAESRQDPQPVIRAATPPAAPVVHRPPESSFLHDFLVVSVSVAFVGLLCGLGFVAWRDLRHKFAASASPADPSVGEMPAASTSEFAPASRIAQETPVALAAPVAPAAMSEAAPLAETELPVPEPREVTSASMRNAFILGRVTDESCADGDLPKSVARGSASPATQEIERLAARLMPSSEGGRVTTLFPLEQGHGATSLIVCLAEAVARNGFNVLLIDADGIDRGLSRARHVAGVRGLAEVLAGISTASKLVVRQDDVSILSVGRIGLDLREHAEAMTAFIEEARQRYDVILIDAAAFDPPSGSTVLCRLSDDFALVACRSKLARDLFVASVEAAAAFPRFSGIILNRELDESALHALAS